MAHVATYSIRGRSVQVAWAAGDTLVAVVVSDVNRLDRVPAIAGWEHLGSAGYPVRGRYYRRVAVFHRRFESAGSGVVIAGEFTYADETYVAVHVLRYSDAHYRDSASYRVQNERAVWPSLATVAAGDVVRVGLLADPAAPVSHTSRVVDVGQMVAVADQVTAGTVGQVLSSSTTRTDGMTWTVLLSSAPDVPVPVLTAPTAVGVATGPVTIGWQPVAGQAAYRVRRVQGSATTYLQGDGTWAGSSADLPGSVSSVAPDFGGGAWSVSVSVQVGGAWSEWSEPKTFVASAPPPAPTVTVADPITVRRPSIAISGGAGAGATWTGWAVEVWRDGYLVESATVTASPWKPAPLPDGTVEFRVATIQNGDQKGPQTVVSRTVAVPPVPVPSVVAETQYLAATIPPGGHFTEGLPGVRLTITSSPPEGLLEVERDGQAFHAGAIGGAVQVDDYSLGATYRVRVGDPNRDPVEWSGWVDVALPPILATGQVGWVVSEQHPEESVQVRRTERAGDVVDLRRKPVPLLDRPDVLLEMGVPLDRSGQFTVSVDSVWARDRLSALLARPWLLRLRWDDYTNGDPGPVDRFRAISYTAEPLLAKRNIAVWNFTIDYQTQDAG